MTIGGFRTKFLREIQNNYDEGEAATLFFIVLSEVLGKSRTSILLELNAPIETVRLKALENILDELKKGRPVQHILGKAPFYGLDFLVNEHTLIPRPETEELVRLVLQKLNNRPNLRLLDIGTGTGCIAIALAKHLNQAKISAYDVSQKALEVAQENAKIHDVKIAFEVVDILNWQVFDLGKSKFDVIVSNPPYVRQSEKVDMQDLVKLYDPATALFVEDDAPLLFYDRIGDFALEYLSDSGLLFFEINQYLGPETLFLLENKGFKNLSLLQDINRVDRLVIAEKSH